MKSKITCIIPAYNEEKRIGRVLSVVQRHPLVDEIIVVDDGSSDNTKAIASRFKKIKLISYKKNKGKTFALLKGINAAKNNLLMFLDSDLLGLIKRDVTNLISPVINNVADISISLSGNSLIIFKLAGLDFVSGERVLHKKILGNIKKFSSLSSFGFESFLNKKIIENKLRIKVVKWANVSHARKSEKAGFVKGYLGEFFMLAQIIKTIGII